MKLTDNFYLKEFIGPETYKQYGDSAIWFIDFRVVRICQFLRERIGKALTVNNWPDQYQFSGYRPPSCTIGASKSQHRFGRAADVKILSEKNNGADKLRDEVIVNFQHYNELGLTTIEAAEFSPTWLHFDCRLTMKETLFIVSP